ncbi:MAG: 2Fe-2S iron-sulfur cluster binding domain-containing protein, partial [Acidobacteria bacterium]|nr:2Fe-2S iron-sulfur cluster binding domain-containing protein [Acidobacteriota bacterium]
MHKITFQLEGGGDETIYASPGENLLDLARKANVAIDAPCSGNGSCGKCRIRLLQGSVESVKSIHLPDSDFLSGWRLACACTITGEASVLIPDIASAYRSRMKTADLSSDGERTVFDALQAELEKA